jgi:2-polyprenyl-3-methyl-5-hydroxy-6-metoxy-1,4-benzoquinol methylase
MHEHLPDDFDWNDIYSGEESDFMPPDPLVLELASELGPGDVLDVGCGAGGLLAALAARGWGLHGVDVAPKAIEAAKKVLGSRGVRAELVVGNAATWTPSRTHDLVTNCFALPLTRAEQIEVYRMIREAVAPGGTVILKDFDSGMAGIGAFGGVDLVEVEHLLDAFDGFEVLRAEVVPTPVHDHGAGTYGEMTWTAALLVARRPLAG